MPIVVRKVSVIVRLSPKFQTEENSGEYLSLLSGNCLVSAEVIKCPIADCWYTRKIVMIWVTYDNNDQF